MGHIRSKGKAPQLGLVSRRWFGAFASLLVLLAPLGDAHPLSFTETTLTLETDGTFFVEMVCDLDALALGVSQDSDDAELVARLRGLSANELAEHTQRLRDLFLRRVRIRFNDDPAPFEVSFPDYGTRRTTESDIPTLFGITARLAGRIPPGASEVEFFASRAFSEVHLEVVDASRDLRIRSVLEPGARSDPFELVGPVESPSAAEVAWQYLSLGFRHIMPEGSDHILFVLGLFLLSPRLRPLLWQITAFTLAHAVTLVLGALEIVALSPHIVEPLIALSIACVAIENMVTDRLSPWRPAIVFMFGLLHGLGFAGVLTELGLPDDERVLALLTFNVGIELGQLAVIAIALITLGLFRHRPWYRLRIVVPLSGVIATIGLVWTVQRVLV